MTDFGIARSLDVKHGMTQTGTVLGTSDYIAPEQAQGQRVDEHTDVYSLGVVLYELLTSEVPFPGENFVAVAMRHINEPPPPIRDERPDVLAARRGGDAAGDGEGSRRPLPARWPTFCRELDACLAESCRAPDAGAPLPASRAARAAAARRLAVAGRGCALLGADRDRRRASRLPGAAASRTATGRRGAPGGGRGGGLAVRLAGATAYDPYGDRPASTTTGRALRDRQHAATFWETEPYHDAPSLGKPGVGLVLDARRTVQLAQLGFATATPGFVARDPGGRLADRAVPRRRRRLPDGRRRPGDHVLDLRQRRTATT